MSLLPFNTAAGGGAHVYRERYTSTRPRPSTAVGAQTHSPLGDAHKKKSVFRLHPLPARTKVHTYCATVDAFSHHSSANPPNPAHSLSSSHHGIFMAFLKPAGTQISPPLPPRGQPVPSPSSATVSCRTPFRGPERSSRAHSWCTAGAGWFGGRSRDSIPGPNVGRQQSG